MIFVHELGHFVVAKLCGVKCEKFYLGFDIAGLKFCKFRWGETEYGIGILPLGGYVKMLGQEDNPAKLREEMERAKARRRGEGRGGDGEISGRETAERRQSSNAFSFASLPAIPVSQSPVSRPSLYDPRSFLAKSVPKRMAIISAGVIMNVIFAFLMAVVAFCLGVRADSVRRRPGSSRASRLGRPIFAPGDRILEIAGKKMKQFRDLQTAISAGRHRPEKGVPILVQRPGVEEPLSVTVKPDSSRRRVLHRRCQPAIPRGCRRIGRRGWCRNATPVLPGSVAARPRPPFHNGDKIVRIDDVPIENYGQINRRTGGGRDKKITVVRRAVRTTPRASRPARPAAADRGRPQPDAALGPGDEDGRDHGDSGRFARRRPAGIQPGDL